MSKVFQFFKDPLDLKIETHIIRNYLYIMDAMTDAPVASTDDIRNLEIRCEPYTLQIKDSTIVNCPCCDSTLQQHIRKGNYLIHECGYCVYLDRPFGGCGTTAESHYGGCSCTYGEKMCLYISCEKCTSSTCIQCKKSLSCRNTNCTLPTRCMDCSNKYDFNNKWKNTTPQEKLHLYGSEKLKLLARNKNIKGYSKYKKHELIHILSPLVKESDFPIK